MKTSLAALFLMSTRIDDRNITIIGKASAIILFSVILTYCEVSPMERNDDEIFTLVEYLTKQRPFSPEKIEKVTGLKLEIVDNKSNEYFNKYISVAKDDNISSSFSIELRVPTSKSSHSDGMLILGIQKEVCITQDDVINRYGEGEFTPPSPGMHPDIAKYYISYRYNWGKISYGLKYKDPKCLETIVLNAIDK